MLRRRIETLVPQIQHFGLEYDTVAKRKKDLGDALENLYRFLNLVAFISLLLGAVGVGSAIQAHLQQKTATGAILRCLGASARTTVFVYLLQAAAMGLIGAIAGAGLGVIMQRLLPRVLQSFLPFAIPDTIFWQPIVRGVLIGFAICILFALPSLLRFRRISPLLVLRASVDSPTTRRDPVLWFIYALMAIGVTAFSISQSETWKRGLAFRRRTWTRHRNFRRRGETAHDWRAQIFSASRRASFCDRDWRICIDPTIARFCSRFR